MHNHDIDRLLEEGLSCELPGEAFRARVLLESTTALVRARQDRHRWHLAALSAAAVLMAGVSFLLGRGSAPQPPTVPAIADAADTVVVPRELVVWLDAARLFKQLGMENRMSRALDCAGNLLPREAIRAGAATGLVSFAAGGEGIDNQRRPMGSARKPRVPRSVDKVNRVLAEFSGGYDHANATD